MSSSGNQYTNKVAKSTEKNRNRHEEKAGITRRKVDIREKKKGT